MTTATLTSPWVTAPAPVVGLPDEFVVDVEQRHIDEGCQGDEYECALARPIIEMGLNLCGIDSRGRAHLFDADGNMVMYHAVGAWGFALVFDVDRMVQPRQFLFKRWDLS